ncbi:helix-turn-helix transcriptional regulator [Flintibacter muris]|uniref:helix-turn-helix domain-containing protein n=1 Tax=Flintibacter muris TaxID=2941327 RepID=UPI0030BA05D7
MNIWNWVRNKHISEIIDISNPYMSNIERAISIPSTEVIMKLALALDTAPDGFLVGTSRWPEEDWRSVAEKLRTLNAGQLELVRRFIDLAAEQPL